MTTVSMEKFITSYPTAQDGLEALGLSDLFELINAVDVREESAAADMLVERINIIKSEHGIRDPWAWLSRNFGLTHARVNKMITRQPVGNLFHHLRHASAPNLRAGYRFSQMWKAWQILLEVPEGFLYGDDFQMMLERLDTTYEQYLPDEASPVLFWLCFHASRDELLDMPARKQAGSEARRVLETTADDLGELWLLDPAQVEPLDMRTFIQAEAQHEEPLQGGDDEELLEEVLVILDNERSDPPMSLDTLDSEDVFETAIRLQYGKKYADLLF